MRMCCKRRCRRVRRRGEQRILIASEIYSPPDWESFVAGRTWDNKCNRTASRWCEFVNAGSNAIVAGSVCHNQDTDRDETRCECTRAEATCFSVWTPSHRWDSARTRACPLTAHAGWRLVERAFPWHPCFRSCWGTAIVRDLNRKPSDLLLWHLWSKRGIATTHSHRLPARNRPWTRVFPVRQCPHWSSARPWAGPWSCRQAPRSPRRHCCPRGTACLGARVSGGVHS